MNPHLRYLIEKLVENPLSLFDNYTSQSVKDKVAYTLNPQMNQYKP